MTPDVRNIFWYPLTPQHKDPTLLEKWLRSPLTPKCLCDICVSLSSAPIQNTLCLARFGANELVYGQNITVYDVIINLFGWIFIFMNWFMALEEKQWLLWTVAPHRATATPNSTTPQKHTAGFSSWMVNSVQHQIILILFWLREVGFCILPGGLCLFESNKNYMAN